MNITDLKKIMNYFLVFVNALLGQGLCQCSLLVTSLLDLCSLVLEPYFQLSLVKTKLRAEILPPLLGQVLAGQELPLQPLLLLRIEGGPWLLLC